MKYTAILLAGSRPGRDHLAAQFGTDMKALVAIAGEPMVRRPVRALLASTHVSQVIILSQAPDRISAVIPKDPRVSLGRSSGTIAETLLEIASHSHTRWPLLVTTADHALLDPEMVDEFALQAEGSDVAIGVVEREKLLSRLPKTERTWLKFRKGAYTGANLFALRSPAVRPAILLWRSVEQDRKKAWRVVLTLGPVALLLAALRLLTIEDVLGRLGKRLGLKVKAVCLSNPLAGIDVDKPADHSLTEAILKGQA
jgi:GTP:adenosylcobinamide-phosphate guanylyltransferase